MSFKEIKMRIKSVPIIGNTYQLLIGNKKIERKRNEAKKNLKQTGVELLKQIEIALNDYPYNIMYFADYGTLLGIIRDHNFIGWDMDIDYGIILDENFDWSEFERHLNRYELRKVREYQYLNSIREQTYEYRGLTIDIFGKIDDGINSIAYGFYTKKDFKYSSPNERHVREVRYVRVLKVRKVDFLGITVTVPDNAEDYLESAYSKNWKIPDPKWDDEKSNNRNVSLLEQLGMGYFDE